MKEKHRTKRPSRMPSPPECLGRPSESVDRSFESLGSAGAPQEAAASGLRETPTHFVLTARFPGLDRSDLRVDATATTLTVRAERRSEEEYSRRHAKGRARSYQSFERTFSLPVAVKASAGKASFQEGVLTVEVPKLRETKVQQVRID